MVTTGLENITMNHAGHLPVRRCHEMRSSRGDTLCVPTCCSFFLPKNGYEIVTRNGKNFHHCAHARADQRSAQHTRAQSTQLARTTERVRTNTNNMTHSAPHSAAQQNQAQEIISQRSATHHGAAHRNITEHTTPQCRATHDNTAHHNTTQHNATH